MESLKTKNLLKMSLHTVGHVVDTQQKPDGEILRFVLFEGFLEGFSQLNSIVQHHQICVVKQERVRTGSHTYDEYHHHHRHTRPQHH